MAITGKLITWQNQSCLAVQSRGCWESVGWTAMIKTLVYVAGSELSTRTPSRHSGYSFSFFPPFLSFPPPLTLLPVFLSGTPDLGIRIAAMEEEIKAEFEKSGFSLDQDDQILSKCTISLTLLPLPSSPKLSFSSLFGRIMSLVSFLLSIRSNVLHQLQAQPGGSGFQLGNILSEQVSINLSVNLHTHSLYHHEVKTGNSARFFSCFLNEQDMWMKGFNFRVLSCVVNRAPIWKKV